MRLTQNVPLATYPPLPPHAISHMVFHLSLYPSRLEFCPWKENSELLLDAVTGVFESLEAEVEAGLEKSRMLEA